VKNIETVSLSEKRVLLRVDFNVPIDKNKNILEEERILAALPTIRRLISDQAKIIIISHLGRPKGRDLSLSLKPVATRLSLLLNKNVLFSDDCISEKNNLIIGGMSAGDVLLLENLRFYKEEKEDSVEFARKLAEYGDVFVNDAFGVSHRKHCSVYTIASFFPKKKYSGYLLNNEINFLEKAILKPKRPLTAIIGGAKISSKIEVIKSLLNKVDNLIIGGGMAYTFAKSMGGSIGNSIIEEEKITIALEIIQTAKRKNVNLLIPLDSVNAKEYKNNSETYISKISHIDADYMGLDIGPESIKLFEECIRGSRSIIWNGPMGVFEMDSFSNGTKLIARAICEQTKKGAFSIVGGGDSVAAIKRFNLHKKVSYISTGGGAMLSYLEGEELPGIAALKSLSE
tara:strand:+ start:2191 stop:3387 length:1197 start_codon:yes stop_codon:yes gene_type:complete